jgi:two-component system cell cycle response regulator
LRILIADDDPVSRRVLETTLMRWGHELVVASDGARAWAELQKEDAPRLAILDWRMPIMDGTEVCRRVRQAASMTPAYIILLTAKGGREDSVFGLREGADDYLTKPFDRDELRARVGVGARMVGLQRSLAERVQRLERAEAELRLLSLTDDLTGLCNRRGFICHAEQYLKVARRQGEGFLLFYADMDGLKQINDNFGHEEGSWAITRMAEILKRTFRESDIIARLGGDEFTALVRDVSPDAAGVISERLRKNLLSQTAQTRHGYELSLSVGFVSVPPGNAATVNELIAKADRAMYEHKRSKRRTGAVNEKVVCAEQ